MDPKGDFKYVFGPVPSRRLGRSLGVDLIPFKTCSYDCIYCQLGKTTSKTIERSAFVPSAEVVDEVSRKLAVGDVADYVTLSGSGEPTLNSEIGVIIEGIKEATDVPVAVLTNGSLLWMPAVRKDLMAADLVVPSLDAADPETFRTINRPVDRIDFDDMVEGLISFGCEFEGRIWLEIFLVKGINDDPKDVEGFIELSERIGPDIIDLNTAVRPTTEEGVKALAPEAMESIAARFTLPTRVIAEFHPPTTGEQAGHLEDIEDMLRRRPCTAEEVARVFGLHPNEVSKYLGELKSQGKVEVKSVGEKRYYSA